MKWTRLSRGNFRDNQAASAIRAGVQPRKTASGGLIQIGAKDVRHSKYDTFQMAEVAVAPVLFAAIPGADSAVWSTVAVGAA